MRSDNRLENLEYVTPLENVRHSIEVLKHDRCGENSHRAKLSENDVKEIRKLLSIGARQTILAARYGVAQAHISAIALGKNWKHLLQEEN